jgi:hypothetical protein
VCFSRKTTLDGLGERQPKLSAFGVSRLLNKVLRCGGLGRGITDEGDSFVNVDLAERARLLQPGLQFCANLGDLAVGFPVLAQQRESSPNSGGIPRDLAGESPLF